MMVFWCSMTFVFSLICCRLGRCPHACKVLAYLHVLLFWGFFILGSQMHNKSRKLKKIKNIVIDSNFCLLQGCSLKGQEKIAIIKSISVQDIYLSSLLFCMVLANKPIRGQNTPFLMKY